MRSMQATETVASVDFFSGQNNSKGRPRTSTKAAISDFNWKWLPMIADM